MKKIVLTFFSFFLFASAEVVETGYKECKTGDTALMGQIFDINHKGIPNVHIDINGCSTLSDSNGTYALLELKESKNEFIYFNSSDYAKAIIPIRLMNDDNLTYIHELNSTLIKYTETYKYNSAFDLNKGNIKIPKNSYIYTVGNSYHGDVNTKIMLRNINKDSDRIIGDNKGFDYDNKIINFKPLSVFELTIFDKNKKDLFLSANIKIIFRPLNIIDSKLVLWKFSEYSSQWEEVGLAYREKNGSYSAHIDQVGIWAVSKD